MTYRKVDYYKDIVVSEKRIGDEFSGCHFRWGWASQQLTIVNDSIVNDIEYSFDGENVAGRLRHGTDADVGGESYTYDKSSEMEIWFRIPEGEPGGEDNLPYRLFVHRGFGVD